MDLTRSDFEKLTGLSIEEEQFNALLLHASSVISKSFFQDQYAYALSLMVAHLHSILSRPYESARDVTGISAGSLSVTFSNATTSDLLSSRWGGLLKSLADAKTKYFTIVV